MELPTHPHGGRGKNNDFVVVCLSLSYLSKHMLAV